MTGALVHQSPVISTFILRIKMGTTRRKTRAVTVGNVVIGGDAPISVQSMAKTRTGDVAATVEEIKKLKPITFGGRQSVIDHADTKFEQHYITNEIP